MVSSVRWLCVMDFFRRSGSWHSVLSPVACLRPCATPSVVLVGKPNKLRNCFYVVVARLFFSPISFTAWCTIQIAMLKQGKGFCRDKSEQSGLGRTGIALNLFLPWNHVLHVKYDIPLVVCVTYFMRHCIGRSHFKKPLNCRMEHFFTCGNVILLPFLLQ